MGKFEPNTELYGQEVRCLDEDSIEFDKGILREIKGPFAYVIERNGELREYEVGASTDFDKDDAGLYLWCPY